MPAHELPRAQLATRSSDNWRPPDEPSYAYLLGIYLGDGYIGRPHPGTVQLSVVLDAQYPEVIREVSCAIKLCVPDIHVGASQRSGAIRVQACTPVWLEAFPQHGPGRKHTRTIRLAPWQEEITRRHPQTFLRGLIHSDGCRVVNRFSTRLPSGRIGRYAYVRYFFTNRSIDIQRIFCEHCDFLGVRWTQSSAKNISISHRESVAKLDEFIGPKS